MCLSLEHQNSSKTSEKMGYFDRVTVSLHILYTVNQKTDGSQDRLMIFKMANNKDLGQTRKKEKTAAVLLPKPSKLFLVQGYADGKPLRWLTQPIWFKHKNVLTLLNASKTTTTSSHRLQQWLPTVVASTPHPSPLSPPLSPLSPSPPRIKNYLSFLD